MIAAPGLQCKLTGRRCQCSACGEFFNSCSLFDRHRVGSHANEARERRCLSRNEMTARGWSVNSSGFWIRSQMPTSDGTTTIQDVINKPEYERPARYGAFTQVKARST